MIQLNEIFLKNSCGRNMDDKLQRKDFKNRNNVGDYSNLQRV